MSEELRKSLVIGGTRYALAVGQAGEGSPGEDTPGKVGVTYLDTAADPPALYACTAAARDGERIVCSWVRVGGAGEGSGQNVDLDTTLTQSGKAADAKAVGDALAGKVGGIGITTIMAITQEDYDELVMLGEVSPTTLYIITASAGGGDAEVTMVPYLVSDGTAYIDTGYKCTANDVLELTYRDIGKLDDGTYIAAATPYCGGQEFHIGYAGSGYVQATYAGVYLGYKLTDKGAKATIKRDPTMLHYNGELVGTATAGTMAGTMSTLIFAKKISDTSVSKCAHKVYFYGLKIWRGDSLVHYYKPAQDESGVACVYDAVTKEYFYNADTEGTLTYGEEVEGS